MEGDIDYLVTNCYVMYLSLALYYDLKEIRCVFSETKSQKDLQKLERIIKVMIHRYFDPSRNVNFHYSWQSRGELLNSMRIDEERRMADQATEEQR